MEAISLELALHMWPEWQQSIRQSRKELGFDAKWPPEEAVPWIEKNYALLIRPKGESELERLELPPMLQQYWEDCLYCDYAQPDGRLDYSKIRRCIAYRERDSAGQETGNWIPAQKSLPKLPYQVGLVHDHGEIANGFQLCIEINLDVRFASRKMIESAAGEAWSTLDYSRKLKYGHSSSTWPLHPVAKLFPRAKKINITEPKRRAQERLNAGEVDFWILLKEEWDSPVNQDEMKKVRELYGENRTTLMRRYRGLRKRIYDRVYGWLPEPKPHVENKSPWWHYPECDHGAITAKWWLE